MAAAPRLQARPDRAGGRAAHTGFGHAPVVWRGGRTAPARQRGAGAAAGAVRLGLALVALLLLAACVPAPGRWPDAPALLYVANGLDGTVVRVDARSGRRVGPALPVGPGPVQLAAGRAGGVLVRSLEAGRGSALAFVDTAEDRPAVRPIPLGPGATVTHLTGDGERTAAVAYLTAGAGGAPGAGQCRVAVVDLDLGATVRDVPACGPRERLTALAVGADPTGPMAYLGLWQAGEPPDQPGGGRLLVLDAARGVPVAALAVDGAPAALSLGPARDRPGARLYAAVATLDADPGGAQDEASRIAQAQAWRLLGLDATTLAPERDLPLRAPALGLTVAPEGRDAYAFATDHRPFGRLLLRIDLLTGTAAPAGAAPGFGTGGLAVTRDRLYVADPFNDRLWTADRLGRARGTVPVGRRPTAIAASRGAEEARAGR